MRNILGNPILLLRQHQPLAHYAALCQEAGLVPVIEPGMLMNGAHTIKRCRDATSAVLFATLAKLRDFGAELPAPLAATRS